MNIFDVLFITWCIMLGVGFLITVFYRDRPFPFPQKVAKKYCINCGYRTEINSHLNVCERPTGKFDPVTGENFLIYKNCEVERADHGIFAKNCGPKAIYYKEKTNI